MGLVLQDSASSHKLQQQIWAEVRPWLASAPQIFHQFITACWCIKAPYITGNVLLFPVNGTEAFDQMWVILPLAEEKRRNELVKKPSGKVCESVEKPEQPCSTSSGS